MACRFMVVRKLDKEKVPMFAELGELNFELKSLTIT
jgi:hypothetical protein